MNLSLFWRKSPYPVLLYLLSLITELALGYFIADKYFVLLLIIGLCFNLIFEKCVSKSHWFQSRVIQKSFLYCKLVFVLTFFDKLLPMLSNKIDFILCLNASITCFSASILIHLLSNLSFGSKKNSILLCSNKSIYDLFSFFPLKAGFIIIYDNDNWYEELQMILKNNKIEKIYIDTQNKTSEVINKLNGAYFNTEINCLEIGNVSISKKIWNDNIPIFANDNKESHNFFGAKILIIGNNYNLILGFLEMSFKLECSSVNVITDCPKIKEKLKEVCKITLFSSDLHFKELDNKYSFDIIFDAYIIESYNFNIYRELIKEISNISKNKKALLSVVKQSPFLETWLLNTAKEFLLKKIFDNTYTLTTVVLRCGEFSFKNFLPNNLDDLIAMKNFKIQNSENIAYSAWKSLWSVEKGSFEILSNVDNQQNNIDTENMLRLFEKDLNTKLNFTMCDNYDISIKTEMLNTYFIKNEIKITNSIEQLVEKIFQKDNVTAEMIISALS